MQEVELLYCQINDVSKYSNKFSLFFMEKRLVAIKTSYSLLEFLAKKKQTTTTLDKILETDQDSFEIAYSDIEKINIGGVSRWGCPFLEIDAGEQYAKFFIKLEHVEKLKPVVDLIQKLKILNS